jgi:hypothetical protein
VIDPHLQEERAKVRERAHAEVRSGAPFDSARVGLAGDPDADDGGQEVPIDSEVGPAAGGVVFAVRVEATEERLPQRGLPERANPRWRLRGRRRLGVARCYEGGEAA